MADNELYGLSLKEQATFLWALCRYSSNPETCPIITTESLLARRVLVEKATPGPWRK